ncbi:hypothetical protein OEIGOIKO_03360 [Streptomyces chrestomyceticus JCM 4735]|uniref:Uncharacterized protein n=1 Tax=Streptomyces chrestomyceticus JCM 4735 TaxID=1306181 RepID=A0A7U9KUI9_9ACTN|nr:hypothetical protein [Streptomyces chrestomyceticus]GCD35614.1 hypothetical protein OEIGOIKO_03360 [Streptomyces chrestomyceticus JCM 4735]
MADTTCITPGQQAPPDLGAALAEIAMLANELCEHLADGQWRVADRIRHLAETVTSPTDHPGERKS